MWQLTDPSAWLQGLATFARRIHPPARKTLSAGQAIETLPTPDVVYIPLHQHAGAPAQSVGKANAAVAQGEHVRRQQAQDFFPVAAGCRSGKCQ